MFGNISNKISGKVICLVSLWLVLLFVCIIEASERTEFKRDLNGDGKEERIVLVREIDTDLPPGEEKFGGERLEIYSEDSKNSPIFTSRWFDYINRQGVIKAGGEIEIVERGKIPPAIAYVHTYTGVGSGGETCEQEYYLYGWNGMSYVLLWEEKTHERIEIYPRHYTDEWQPGSYKEIIKKIDFVDLDKDGVKDIIIKTEQYEIPVIQKTPDSKKVEVPKQPSIKFLTKEKRERFYWRGKGYLKKDD